MTTLEMLVQTARELGASDIHLEGGLAPAFRVQGDLRMRGEELSAATMLSLARELLTGEAWSDFGQQHSYDLSRVIQGVRCRINVLRTTRGVGMAIRVLSSFQATLAALNLHPDLRKIVANRNGLILVSGPTGSGKSSTVAALLQEINLTSTRHIITVESPVEYTLIPQRSLIRQRQVGRDTPSFEQALVDALREDPDVLMVGEMREPQTMRLTLNAAETGHLVISTLHSASTAEALNRVVSAFSAEIQSSICAQLADCLTAVICQRLDYRPDVGIRVPVCEILMPSSGVRGMVRMGQFSKIGTALESGGQDGQWTFARYRSWLDGRSDWVLPSAAPAPLEPDVAELPAPIAEALKTPRTRPPAPRPPPSERAAKSAKPPPETPEDGVLVIDDVDEDPAEIVRKLR